MLRRIMGIEFVEEAVAALGVSTELADHLFRECWAEGTGSDTDLCRAFGWGGGGAQLQGRDGGRPGGAGTIVNWPFDDRFRGGVPEVGVFRVWLP
jgi:hypothetical protein